MKRCGAAALVAFISVAVHGGSLATPLPHWMQGKWEARSLVSNPDALGWGQEGVQRFTEQIRLGRLTIGPNRIEAAHTTDVLLDGIGAAATVRHGTFASLFDGNGRFYVYGDPQAIEPSSPVAHATVTFRACKVAPGIDPMQQFDAATRPYQAPCGKMDIYRFPDAHHIAINPGDMGWVVYSRVGGTH